MCIRDRDVTFKAQWEKVFRVEGKVTEETEGTDPQAVTGAVVSLWLGANKLNETTTDSNGDYHFDNLTPGIYNLVVTKDVRTVTKKVEIKAQNAVRNAILPKGATNSIVEVLPGSPDIVVGQLDTMFNSPGDAVYTQEDARTVEEGGKVEITFKAAEKQPEDTGVSSDLEKIEKIGGSNLALVMDYTLEKTVTNADGTAENPVQITEANVLLEVRLPLPGELQGKQSYTVSVSYTHLMCIRDSSDPKRDGDHPAGDFPPGSGRLCAVAQPVRHFEKLRCCLLYTSCSGSSPR